MSDIFSTLQTLMIDNVRLSFMNQMRVGETPSMTRMVGLTLLVGLLSWAYDFLSGNYKSWRQWTSELRALIQPRNSITIEGKHVTAIDQYRRSPIVVSNTFSKTFRAIMFHIMKSVDNLSDVREMKEMTSSYLSPVSLRINDKDGSETVSTIFSVCQRAPFLLNTEKEIYCSVNETNDINVVNDSSKQDARINKFAITLFSYKSSIVNIRDYIRELKSAYMRHLEDSRKGKLFVYTLNHTDCSNDDDDDTVPGKWHEVPHETMKSFDNVFFENKEEILKKVDFFVNNKEWYKTNGIPYTLGIGLYGPPGTGKTSFIKALSSKLGRHIISIPLSIVKTKTQMQDVYYESQYMGDNEKNSIGFDKKIIVFEDIDCVGDVVMKRKETGSETNSTDSESLDQENNDVEGSNNGTKGRAKTDNEELANNVMKIFSNKIKSTVERDPDDDFCSSSKKDKLTLDYILNLWDGLRENTGRIMIITSNHYDKLDPALVRPGRIDITLNLDFASVSTICEMYKHYYGKPVEASDIDHIPDKFYSTAEIINFYVSNCQSPEGFIERLARKEKL